MPWLTMIVAILLGGALGALVGSRRSCESGTCPLTATPWRGGLYGAVLGLLLSVALAGGPGREDGFRIVPPTEPAACPVTSTGASAKAPAKAGPSAAPSATATKSNSNTEKEMEDGDGTDEILSLTMENIDQIEEGLVLLHFYSPSCPPCRLMQPVIERFAQTVGPNTRVATLNIARQFRLGREYGIRAVPVTMLLHDGLEVDRILGLASAGELEAMIKRFADDQADETTPPPAPST